MTRQTAEIARSYLGVGNRLCLVHSCGIEPHPLGFQSSAST
jgi:hypothetical protein